MECPGCGAYSSSVLIPVQRGEPCPFCGLSASAITEVHAVRQARGDAALRERVAALLIERDKLGRQLGVASRILRDVQITLARWEGSG